LNEEAAKIGALGEDEDDDDELEEESLLETPLDVIEPYALLRDGLMSKCTIRRDELCARLTRTTELRQEQPQFYEGLMKELDGSEQQILQAAVAQADVIAAQAAANPPAAVA